VEYTAVPVRESALDTEQLQGAPPLSAIVTLKVDGPTLFKRDRNGLLLKEEALRVAKEKYGKPVNSAEAVLRETETELLDWWVTLEKAPSDVGQGENRLVAYCVSPYGGFVRKETEPFTVDPDAFLEKEMQDIRYKVAPRAGLAPEAGQTPETGQAPVIYTGKKAP